MVSLLDYVYTSIIASKTPSVRHTCYIWYMCTIPSTSAPTKENRVVEERIQQIHIHKLGFLLQIGIAYTWRHIGLTEREIWLTRCGISAPSYGVSLVSIFSSVRTFSHLVRFELSSYTVAVLRAVLCAWTAIAVEIFYWVNEKRPTKAARSTAIFYLYTSVRWNFIILLYVRSSYIVCHGHGLLIFTELKKRSDSFDLAVRVNQKENICLFHFGRLQVLSGGTSGTLPHKTPLKSYCSESRAASIYRTICC